MTIAELTTDLSHIMIGDMEYVSLKEAADLTGYKVSYLRLLVQDGKIKAIKKGTMWWVELESLKEYKRKMDLLGREKYSPWRDEE